MGLSRGRRARAGAALGAAALAGLLGGGARAEEPRAVDGPPAAAAAPARTFGPGGLLLEGGLLLRRPGGAPGGAPVVLARDVRAFLRLGDQIYVAYEEGDVQMIDLSDPLQPRRGGRFSTLGPITKMVQSGSLLLLHRADGSVLQLSLFGRPVDTARAEDAPPRRAGEGTAAGLLIAGPILFGLTYLITAGTSGALDESCHGKPGCAHVPMYTPVLGPFVELATNGAIWSTGDRVGIALSGLFQCTGAALLITGAVLQSRLPKVAPLAIRGGGGLLLAGWF